MTAAKKRPAAARPPRQTAAAGIIGALNGIIRILSDQSREVDKIHQHLHRHEALLGEIHEQTPVFHHDVMASIDHRFRTLTKEIRAMEDETRQSLDRFNATLDQRLADIGNVITSETAEIKDLINRIPVGGSETEIQKAIDAANAKVEEFATAITTSIQSVSDQVAPPAGGGNPGVPDNPEFDPHQPVDAPPNPANPNAPGFNARKRG